MSLRQQLSLVLSILFLFVLVIVLWAGISGTRRYLETQLASHAQDAASALSIMLAQSIPKNDPILVDAQVSSLFDRGYFKEVLVLGADKSVILKKELPEKIEGVPDWFIQKFPMETTAGEAHITTGWRQLGKVIVASQPTFAYQYLWRTAAEMSIWLATLFAASLLGMQLLLRFVLYPLRRIENSAIAVQNKRFEQITQIPHAPELGRVVRAMNDMSRRVGEMLDAETERAEELYKRAYEDEMTGLANRAGFEIRLNELLNGNEKFEAAIILSLDLNDMRLFNRSHGFNDGKAIMRGIADAAHKVLAGEHTTLFGRINEFSFAFVVVDLNADEIGQRAASLREHVQDEIARSPAAGQVSFCLGGAWFHQDYTRGEVFSRADLAVETARQSGRNSLAILPDKRDNTSALGSFGWRMLIQNALSENRWLLVAQPAVRLSATHELIHSELMARLIDDKSQLVPATSFLPMAARHQLMPEVDKALVTLGLNYLRGHNGNEAIAINLSPQGIANKEFMNWLEDRLSELKGNARYLSLEISEFGCLRNLDAAAQIRSMARKHRAHFGIDNFGLDPASLKLLRQLPPDYIKLSGGLITEVATSPDARTLIDSFVQLAHSLDVSVYAQHVESEQQVAALVEAGLEGGQGYLFGAPH